MNSSHGFQAINSKLHRCYKHFEDVHVTFSRRKNDKKKKKKKKNNAVFDLDIFEIRLQYRAASLCNQLQEINMKPYKAVTSIFKMCM